MSVFEDINDTTNRASLSGERYIRSSHKYIKLKIFQQLTLSISLLTKILIVGSLVFAGLVFLSVAGAIHLGNIVNSYALGCLLVGLIYISLGIIMYLIRSKFNSFVIKKVGTNFFN